MWAAGADLRGALWSARLLHEDPELIRAAPGVAREFAALRAAANVFVLMIDPISRDHFQRALPRTARLLPTLGFAHLANYSAVGPNSGPNQVPLYTGRPLVGRDVAALANRSEWIWDELRGLGYATLKAEDGCVENSNMVQSVAPRVDHGDQLARLFCQGYTRPACLGGRLAAAHLLGYAKRFARGYSRAERPWAAFVSLVDSHEDSMVVAAHLDDVLHGFFSKKGRA